MNFETKKYPDKLKGFLESLQLFESNNDRVNFLIDYAEQFRPVPESIATKPYPDNKRVEFCESGAYVWTLKEGDRYKFFFDVMNPQGISAKSVCAIFEETLNGETSEKILSVPDDFVFDVFGQNLSMGKNLGLTNILAKMKSDVRKLQNK